jgi:hypothetical protein
MTTAPDAGLTTVSTGWTADKTYSVSFSTVTRLIIGLYGALAPFADIVHNDTSIENHYIGTMTKEIHDAIAESILNPSHLSFWMPDNTLKVRKMMVEFGPNTYLDNKKNAIVGVDNTVTLVPSVVDQDGKVWNDITQIEIKNLQKLDFPMSINGAATDAYKTKTTNGAPTTFKLEKTGRATIRFKALVPELSSVWLSLYPELYGYDADQLAAFSTWVESQPK